jgi:hypothetical protein
MMSLPELPKGLLVSISGMPDEVSLASRHAYPPSVVIVHPKEGKRFPIPYTTHPLAHSFSPRDSLGA